MATKAQRAEAYKACRKAPTKKKKPKAHPERRKKHTGARKKNIKKGLSKFHKCVNKYLERFKNEPKAKIVGKKKKKRIILKAKPKPKRKRKKKSKETIHQSWLRSRKHMEQERITAAHHLEHGEATKMVKRKLKSKKLTEKQRKAYERALNWTGKLK